MNFNRIATTRREDRSVRREVLSVDCIDLYPVGRPSARSNRWFTLTHASRAVLVAVLAIQPLMAVEPVRAAEAESGAESAREPIQLKSFELQDYRGKTHRLSDVSDAKLVVLIFTGTECPLAKLYAPRMSEFAGRYADRGVGVFGVFSNQQDSVTEIVAYARRHDLQFPLLKDLGNRLADKLGAERTPEVFVLDQQRHVRYSGRIDDQYGVGYAKDRPSRSDLEQAVNELLAGKPVSISRTEPVGCHIGRIKQPTGDESVTYSNQIARILQNRCVECHRDGEIAPFALTDYDEVVGWAQMISEVVEQQRMPPWHASGEFGRFQNDRHLSAAEQQLIHQWVRNGAPEGDRRELPAPRKFVSGWQLPREPDFVRHISDQPFRVQAEGAVRYKYFEIDPGFEQDKWVKAVEIRPGNRLVVHHILMLTRLPGEDARSLGGGAMGYDGLYVPGQRVVPYPPGMAKRIPAGSQLIFQVHYTPVGSVQFDQSQVGFVFADADEITHEVITASAVNTQLRIPPHERSYRVSATSRRGLRETQLLALNAHMHLRGSAFRYTALFPDGREQVLLDIPHYDFNWQTAYLLAEPLVLPAGTAIRCDAEFDNSAENLNNPNPDETVRWGEQTWDEMMIGYFDVAVPVGRDSGFRANRRVSQTRAGSATPAERLLNRLDKNGDGFIEKSEVSLRYRLLFTRLDKNGDKRLSAEELEGLASQLRR